MNYALQHFPHQEPTPDARRRIEEAFQAAKSRVFTATISVEPSGAEVLVDGASVGRAPLGADVFLDVGAHTIEATLDGYESAKRDVDAQAGGSEKIELNLVKSASAPSGLSNQGPADPKSGASNPNGNSKPDSTSSTKTVVVVSGLALTGVALAVGIGFFLDSNSAKSDADGLRERSIDQLGKDGCATAPNNPTCAELGDTLDRKDRSSTWSVVGFTAAGVFGAATAATWLFWKDDQQQRARPHAPSVKWTPVVGRTTGLAISGSF